MFVVKLDARGERFVWATYLGGSRGSTSYRGPAEAPRGIAIDAEGNVAVSGVTDMTDFPVLNSLVASKTGNSIDGFLTKISATDRDSFSLRILAGRRLTRSPPTPSAIRMSRSRRRAACRTTRAT
jgi:hypothetical protein